MLKGASMLWLEEKKTTNTGWTVEVRLSIALQQKDQAILELIKSNLGGIGKIYKASKDCCQYQVNSLQDINRVIIPHFDMYPLITQKKADFILFKKVVELMNNKQHLTPEGLQQIVNLRASINKGLSSALKEAFPNTIQVQRPLVVDQVIKDPNWVAGFVSGVRRPGVSLLT